ncbi:ANO4 [Cordylochernes scorpioides]|uniref:Anoctamin n=1 Tax=Cordylochernes scorpioides TaxID=51811 RepID=A0ABY6KJL8_9ARAC|nr:ANO4 [Cordylochernes scorpioides]
MEVWGVLAVDVQQAFEPYLTLWQKIGRMVGSNSVVLFMLCLVLAAVFGIIVYRIAIVATLYASEKTLWRTNAKLITSSSAALLNLMVIIIMDKVYRVLATFLTNIGESHSHWISPIPMLMAGGLQNNPGPSANMKIASPSKCSSLNSSTCTHPSSTLLSLKEDSSVILEMPLHYLVSVKTSTRGQASKNSNHHCELGGCLFEVCIQLAIIMVGKQIMNNITELFYTKIMNWWRQWWRAREGPQRDATTRWELDYNLQECDSLALFDEYLEMVIQYGFVTLFVAAFPLAPLFALLNNIVEIRLDAYKYVTQLQRPVSARVPNIGAWQTILHSISIFAVISNAFMIAYTSDFIPRLVYMYVYSEHGTLWGYINNSLSYFNTSDFPANVMPENQTLEYINSVKICRYQDYRLPPESEKKYNLTMEYWHIFAARLSFVVVFEHLVFFITGMLAYLIPDIPSSVKQKILRQRFLAREALNRVELEENRRALVDMGLLTGQDNNF